MYHFMQIFMAMFLERCFPFPEKYFCLGCTVAEHNVAFISLWYSWLEIEFANFAIVGGNDNVFFLSFWQIKKT